MWRPSGKTGFLGVIGHPVSHTLSPAMHNALLRHCDLDAVYLPLPCPPENLPAAIAGLRAMGFVGANITLPHKEAVLPLLDAVDPEAEFMGSVNTVYWKDGLLRGTTTDPYGALRNLVSAGVDPRGLQVGIIGGGGSAKAVAYGLLRPDSSLQCGTPASLSFFLRNPEKLSHTLSALQSLQVAPVNILDWAAFSSHSPQLDLIIQTTPLGMHPHIDASPIAAADLHPGQIVCDIIYRPRRTRFLQDAQSRGCRTVEGLGMLLYQGARSFTHWFGIQPDTAIMAQALQLALEEEPTHAI